MPKLIDTQCKAAKARDKAYKLSDSHGLVLFIFPSGSKKWRLRYRWQGKEQTYSIGDYPELGLFEARKKCFEIKSQIKNKENPKFIKDNKRRGFADWAGEWMASMEWVDKHRATVVYRLEKLIYPHIGGRGLNEIEPPDILFIINLLQNAGKIETARRVKSIISQVYCYAIAQGGAKYDPTASLHRGVIRNRQIRSMPAITDPRKIGALLNAIDNYPGGIVVKYALKIAPFIFLRPGALRCAQWDWVDWQQQLMRLPANIMKNKKEHLVPLANQVINLFKELQKITGVGGMIGMGKYLFPAVRGNDRPLSDGTLTVALRTLGYTNDEIVPHGFRTTASTLLNEMGFSSDVIERQLAHVEQNKVRGAYNRAEYLEQRREMMQAWADYLDRLKLSINP